MILAETCPSRKKAFFKEFVKQLLTLHFLMNSNSNKNVVIIAFTCQVPNNTNKKSLKILLSMLNFYL